MQFVEDIMKNCYQIRPERENIVVSKEIGYILEAMAPDIAKGVDSGEIEVKIDCDIIGPNDMFFGTKPQLEEISNFGNIYKVLFEHKGVRVHVYNKDEN